MESVDVLPSGQGDTDDRQCAGDDLRGQDVGARGVEQGRRTDRAEAALAGHPRIRSSGLTLERDRDLVGGLLPRFAGQIQSALNL